MISIEVSASRCYEVLIGKGVLSLVGETAKVLHPKAKKAHIVTDFHVYDLYQEPVEKSLSKAGFEVTFSCLRPGETVKSGYQFLTLLDDFAAEKITRSDVIIALGGGVIGDLAGFAAATYQRGIAYIQLPTTLLAMVDASVGGKTAINLSAGKNLAGAFYQPSLVLCDTATLETLPDAVYRDGFAEVIKYAMLGSRKLLKALLSEDEPDIEQIIAQCVTLKRDIVAQDEFDQNQRILLNLGHTIGHAIEQLSEYEISHGAAVAIGMAIDTRAAVALGFCPEECLLALNRLLSRFALPSQTDFTPKALYEAALGDKKRSGNTITMTVPRTLGRSEWTTIPTEALLEWIERGHMPCK